MKRAEREREHFNEVATSDSPFLGENGIDFVSHPCLPENGHLNSLMPKSWKGLRILDLGCGLGEAAISFAKRGATVVAVDVSDVSLERGRAAAQKVGVPVDFQKVYDSTLPFEDGTFDLVFGNGVLHHIDLSGSLPEIRRVLKSSGFGFFIEPTTGNPLIAVYRVLASKKRSPDEHPLTSTEYDLVRKTFDRVEITPFQLFTTAAFLKMFLFEFKNPNKFNYWREPILHPEPYQAIYAWGNKLDEIAKKAFPKLFSLLCWNNVLVLRKKN